MAWIDSVNRNHYLGVSIWSLPRIADAQSLWNEVTASLFPNSTAGGVPCSTLISFGCTGCGYYDDDVGAFAYIVPTSWTSDVVGKAQGCWWNFATSEPRGSLTSCMVAGTAGPESTAIVPGYTGINQESAPGTNIENFSNPQAVVRCNVFRVKVPGRRDDCGRCR